MRRLPSSSNKHHITDDEIAEVFAGIIGLNIEMPLESRNYGERVLYIGLTATRSALIKIGIEDQNGELVVFHAREVTRRSTEVYEAQIHG